jgi:hypothetical protein
MNNSTHAICYMPVFMPAELVQAMTAAPVAPAPAPSEVQGEHTVRISGSGPTIQALIEHIINEEDESLGPDLEDLRMFTRIFVAERCDMTEPCTVCQAEFSPGNILRQLPCQHIFHMSCIDRCFENDSRCPVCRGNIIRDSPTRFGDIPEAFRTPLPSASRTRSAQVDSSPQEVNL